jgi:hypothetical protein
MNIKLKKMCRVLYHHSQKFQNRNKFIYYHYDIELELGIEEQIFKVASSKSVISAPLYDNYESSNEEFQT